jgi:hypothetical protein
MSAHTDDWRLQGQERYLKGASLYWTTWKQSREHWDHDHCAFCGAKFMAGDNPEFLHEGYTTADEYHWICKPCVDDFKDMFGWHIEGEVLNAIQTQKMTPHLPID